MFQYEMHCHTAPVSACARAAVAETVQFYKDKGYDGLFITNHFLDGNIGIDRAKSYREKIEFYFADYEQAAVLGRELGIRVFDGVEMSYGGTDFLVYGLHKDWYLANSRIMEMSMTDKLRFLRENGAYVVHAHPFREASYIDHIRLFPRCVDAVEIINAGRTDPENEMAAVYARQYGLKAIAGSDNHLGAQQWRLAGIQGSEPICSVEDFIEGMRRDAFTLFDTLS